MSEARLTDQHGSTPGITALELRGITKSFPGVLANDNVSFTVAQGEVLCLLGENGAGKSTLVSIIAGMQQADGGSIWVNGAKASLNSPHDSLRYSIGVVYQHSTLIPAFSVLENLMLVDGAASGSFKLDRAGARRRFAELCTLLGVVVDADARAGDLGLGQQQQVEIVRALWRGSRILILDEPTSMLTPQGIADLEATIARLTAEGIAIVLITHKLREVFAVATAVTVLRAGRSVLHVPSARLGSARDEDDARTAILQAMFGDATDDDNYDDTHGDTHRDTPRDPHRDTEPTRSTQNQSAAAPASHRPGTHVLELRGLSTTAAPADDRITDIALTLSAGEIVGIAGIDGNGQRGLAEAIAGQRKPSAGTVLFNGDDVTSTGVRGRQLKGLRYVTDDRQGEGSVGNLSVAFNLVLKRIGERPFWRRGVVNQQAIDAEATRLVREFDIRTPSIQTRAATLSGGNLQKLLLARELSHNPSVLVVSKPTYGLDAHTVDRVRALLKHFVSGGGAVLLLSADLDELVDLSHRIGVLQGGRLVALINNDTDEAAARVGSIMAGG